MLQLGFWVWCLTAGWRLLGLYVFFLGLFGERLVIWWLAGVSLVQGSTSIGQNPSLSNPSLKSHNFSLDGLENVAKLIFSSIWGQLWPNG